MSPLAKHIFGINYALDIQFFERKQRERDEKEEEKAEMEEPLREYKVRWVLKSFIFRPLVFIGLANLGRNDFNNCFKEGRFAREMKVYEKWFEMGVQKWIEYFGATQEESYNYGLFEEDVNDVHLT